MMKNLVHTICWIAFLILFRIGNIQAQTVYITETGKKFHAKNCELAKTGKKGIEWAEAKKKGYEPCKICKSEAILKEQKKTPASKVKK